MAQDSPDWKALYFTAVQARQDADQARQAADQERQAADQARQAAEVRTRPTTLLEFLDACHTHLSSNLRVETDKSLATTGNPENAHQKVRPAHIRHWDSFAEEQSKIWAPLMKPDFPQERLFASLIFLEETGKLIRRRKVSSEFDLSYFQRQAAEDHVTSIVEHLYEDPRLRKKFRLQGSVGFVSHANTLSPESVADHVQEMHLGQRRRSPRLQAQRESSTSTRREINAAAVPPSFRPLADQFCVYNTGTENSQQRIAAYIGENKAPHKLPLGYIYDGLEDMDLEDVVYVRDGEDVHRQLRRLVAAVVTQAFSYMIRAGLEYGCINTGEATIFLRVPEDDPRTVYYFLSVPQADVGESTGWMPDSDGDNRLHLTMVGQLLAFTLRAMKTTPRSRIWRNNALQQLETWEVVYEEIFERVNHKEAPSSEYRPPRHNAYHRTSPVKLRPHRSTQPGCSPTQEQPETSDDESDPDTPSRPRRQIPSRPTTNKRTHDRNEPASHQGESTGEYCTDKCLLGLRDGGKLDPRCVNARYHGSTHHEITRQGFLDGVQRQLEKDPDDHCQTVGLPGARGILFKISLKQYGYTVAAKGSPGYFVPHLQHEATVYDRLRPIQGKEVPVHLGSIDLEGPYSYEGVVDITHFMMMSFAGQPIHRVDVDNELLQREVHRSLRAIHQCGVLHCDPEPRNLLWHHGKARIIDFERAKLVERRSVLGTISPNRKRKREEGFPKLSPNRFSREASRAIREVKMLAKD